MTVTAGLVWVDSTGQGSFLTMVSDTDVIVTMPGGGSSSTVTGTNVEVSMTGGGSLAYVYADIRLVVRSTGNDSKLTSTYGQSLSQDSMGLRSDVDLTLAATSPTPTPT